MADTFLFTSESVNEGHPGKSSYTKSTIDNNTNHYIIR